MHEFFCGATEWWFEFLDFRTCIGVPLISSWQDLRHSLILKFTQDDYEKILYLIDKQIHYIIIIVVVIIIIIIIICHKCNLVKRQGGKT